MASGRSIGERPYIPLLKSKQGERIALRHLAGDVRDQITPGFHLRPRRTEQQISSELSQIATGWRDVPILLDAAGVDATNLSAHPFVVAHRAAVKAKLALIPVVSDSTDDAGLVAARTVLDAHGAGAAIRLSPAAWLSAQSVLEPLLQRLGADAGDIDLVLDAGTIANVATLQLAQNLLAAHLSDIARLDSWRRLAVAGGSFPVDLGGLPARKPIRLPRREWAMWRAKPAIGRPVAYADYGVAHPDTPDEFENPRAIPLYASIRYTSETEFVVAKGGDVNKEGPGAMYAVCAIVAGEPEYDGPGSSWADDWIADRAAGNGEAGNYSTWRKVGTVRHITKIVSLLAS